MRSDCGTENTGLAASHMTLRHNHQDNFNGEKSFRFGSSTTNTVSMNVASFPDRFFSKRTERRKKGLVSIYLMGDSAHA